MIAPTKSVVAAALPFPPEICQTIASHLDRPALASLALTCRAFQLVAEADLYSRFDLCQLEATGAAPHRHGPPVNDPLAIVNLLQQNPTKAQHLRSLCLSLMPSPWEPQSSRILRDVAKNLEDLDLRIAPGPWPPVIFNSFISSLDEGLPELSRLKRIAIPVSVFRTSTLAIIFGLTHRLEAMTLYHSVKPFIGPTVQVQARAMPSTLKEITLTTRTAEDVSGVIDLLAEAAPTPVRLSLPPPGGSQHVTPGAVCWPIFIDNVRLSEKLEVLEAPTGLPWRWETGGFDQLRHLTLWREYDRCYVPSFLIMDQVLPTKEVIETIKVKSASAKDGQGLVWCKALTHVLLCEQGQLMHMRDKVEQNWISMDGHAISEGAFAKVKGENLGSDERCLEISKEGW